MNTVRNLALAFLAGVVLMAATIYRAGARSTLPGFLAGVLVVIVPLILLLCSARRIRRAAELLDAFAQALDSRGRRQAPQGRAIAPAASRPAVVEFTAERVGYRKPSTAKRDQILQDTISEYLDDDLFGTPAKAAQQ